jgi:hypothetical protein
VRRDVTTVDAITNTVVINNVVVVSVIVEAVVGTAALFRRVVATASLQLDRLGKRP